MRKQNGTVILQKSLAVLFKKTKPYTYNVTQYPQIWIIREIKTYMQQEPVHEYL